jgi:hypothetical protein
MTMRRMLVVGTAALLAGLVAAGSTGSWGQTSDEEGVRAAVAAS